MNQNISFLGIGEKTDRNLNYNFFTLNVVTKFWWQVHLVSFGLQTILEQAYAWLVLRRVVLEGFDETLDSLHLTGL